MKTLDPHLMYPDARFFLDFVDDPSLANTFFQHTFDALRPLTLARRSLPNTSTRDAVCSAMLNYNRALGASGRTLERIEALRDPASLCVIGGQQAGFLGGPLFVVFKIASILCAATQIRERLDVPVIPIFWLASEDHDFDEINRVTWIDASGAAQTRTFDWTNRGHPIECLPITSDVRRAYEQALHALPFRDPSHADIFAPEPSDTYATWHSRIWSRLFADEHLVLVEPRVLRPLAAPLFERAVSDAASIHTALASAATQLESRGYSVPLDPARSGTLFTTAPSGRRQRLDEPPSNTLLPPATMLSPDAALRPLLADALLPTVAHVLGPSELAYHAMLRPLYEGWSIPQPIPIVRHGGTLISRRDAGLLATLNIDVRTLLTTDAVARDVVSRPASERMRAAFDDTGARLEGALAPLKTDLIALDPGLGARWRQTLDQCHHQLARLEARAARADWARHGVSVKRLLALPSILTPSSMPQERIVSTISAIADYGVEWIRTELLCGEPTRFIHRLIVLEDSHD